MKKLLLTVFCITISFALAGCTFQQSETTKDTVTPATTKPATSLPTKQVITGTVINAQDTVNIRSEANSKCEILGKAKNGDIFVVLTADYNDNWHQIEYNGKTAYIYKDYFKINDSFAIFTAITPTTAVNPTATVKPTANASSTVNNTKNDETTIENQEGRLSTPYIKMLSNRKYYMRYVISMEPGYANSGEHEMKLAVSGSKIMVADSQTLPNYQIYIDDWYYYVEPLSAISHGDIDIITKWKTQSAVDWKTDVNPEWKGVAKYIPSELTTTAQIAWVGSGIEDYYVGSGVEDGLKYEEYKTNYSEENYYVMMVKFYFNGNNLVRILFLSTTSDWGSYEAMGGEYGWNDGVSDSSRMPMEIIEMNNNVDDSTFILPPYYIIEN